MPTNVFEIGIFGRLLPTSYCKHFIFYEDEFGLEIKAVVLTMVNFILSFHSSVSMCVSVCYVPYYIDNM